MGKEDGRGKTTWSELIANRRGGISLGSAGRTSAGNDTCSGGAGGYSRRHDTVALYRLGRADGGCE